MSQFGFGLLRLPVRQAQHPCVLALAKNLIFIKGAPNKIF
jgi:hypothetical protein